MFPLRELTLVVRELFPHSVVTMKFTLNFEFWHQIKAMTIRNVLIKRREIKKTFSVSVLLDVGTQQLDYR